MTDRGILFSAPMIKALLDGRKTMTRRLAFGADGKPTIWQKVKPGDRLWVRETVTCSGAYIQYLADGKVSRHIWPAHWKQNPRPSIHLDRQFSRLTLTVTAVKVEQLHDMLHADAVVEGVEGSGCNWKDYRGGEPLMNAGASFASLWVTLHGKDSWDRNPDLVAMSFIVEQRNIDQPPESTKARRCFQRRATCAKQVVTDIRQRRLSHQGKA